MLCEPEKVRARLRRTDRYLIQLPSLLATGRVQHRARSAKATILREKTNQIPSQGNSLCFGVLGYLVCVVARAMGRDGSLINEKYSKLTIGGCIMITLY